jgi:glycosyltransferase involved in cell wall biosynthesis
MASLRSAAWALLRLPGRLAYRRSLERVRFDVPREVPVLNYGGVLPRGGKMIVAGGKVKLRHLDRAFPESERCNVLYLVSSAVPPHAAELVRWAKARGIKVVWNQNGVAFPAWAGKRLAETNEPMAELLRLADFVIYQSAFCRESADHFLGSVSVPSRVLFNPVDLAEFSPAAKPPPLDCWRLLTAGTHYQPSRVLGPLEALRHIRKSGQAAHLTIAGELRWPGARTEVEAALTRNGLHNSVTFRPAFTQAEAVALFHDAHLLLHLKYHDPCPTVVIEALACGVPVIGSRSGGMPELVGTEAGELIDVALSWERSEPPDPAAVKGAVERLMGEWTRRRQAARSRAERLFDVTGWVAEHRRIFASVLGS